MTFIILRLDSKAKIMQAKKVEIMAPAGSFESLAAAVNAGCDSVYFGVEQLNMRARSSVNLTTEDLKEIVARCADRGVKSYLTINTVLYDHDIRLMKTLVDQAKECGVSAIIASAVANGAVALDAAVGHEPRVALLHHVAVEHVEDRQRHGGQNEVEADEHALTSRAAYASLLLRKGDLEAAEPPLRCHTHP